MRTAAICPTCATYINALCVIYDGPGLTNINVAPFDNLDDILQSINDNLVPVHGSGAPTNGAVYEGQIYIDDVTGEVYIATATGGGAGDWEQLALQSAIPPTPSLDDVLLAGNTSTQNIIIEDNLITPTTVATISPLFVSVFDVAAGDVTRFESKALSFYDGASGFTATITAPATFTTNTTIAFPSSSGTIALLSDITAGQNLQTVLTAGNIATGIGMLIENGVISVYDTGVINNIDIDGTTGSIRITTAGGTGEISATNLTSNQSFELPDQSGTLALQPTFIFGINLSVPIIVNGQKNGFYTVDTSGPQTVQLDGTQWNDLVTITFLARIPFTFSVVGPSTISGGQPVVTASGIYNVTYLASGDVFFIGTNY